MYIALSLGHSHVFNVIPGFSFAMLYYICAGIRIGIVSKGTACV